MFIFCQFHITEQQQQSITVVKTANKSFKHSLIIHKLIGKSLLANHVNHNVSRAVASNLIKHS